MPTPGPATEYSPAELVQKWEEFFDAADLSGRILAVADAYPETRSLEVLFDEVNRFDTDFAIYLQRRPQDAIAAGEEAVVRIAPPGDAPRKIHVRVTGLPRDARVLAQDVRRTELLGRLVAVEGLVRKVADVRPRIVDAALQCLRCNAVVREPQEGGLFREPLECYEDQGGCGRSAASTKFKLLGEMCKCVDGQKLEVQDPPELLQGGQQPARLEVHLEDDLVGELLPGERVVFGGIVRSAMRGRIGARSTDLDVYLEANAYERERTEFENLDVTAEDEARIREEAARPDVIDRIVQSIAPSIYGLETEKEALALQLFSGGQLVLPDGMKIRGDVSVLLFGDPATAKSQLLLYMYSLAPRAMLSSGRGATAAGLLGAAVKDDFGEGRWTIEAGTLPLADKGLAIVDELEKMKPEDRQSIHMAMEQQLVTIDKAGIHVHLPARCAMLAAANPKLGRFVREKGMGEQLASTFDAALLSRFDAIFFVQDVPEKVRDERISRDILHGVRLGQVRRALDALAAVPEIAEPAGAFRPYYEPAFLRKYVAIAKRVCPVLTDEAMAVLQDYYVAERNNGGGLDSPVQITPRQIHGLIRFADAAARARLSAIIEPADAQRAVRITEYWIRQVASVPGTDLRDIDAVMTGIPASQRDQIVLLHEIIGELGGTESGEGADWTSVLDIAEHRGVPRDRAEAWLRKWVSDGELYAPVHGRLKLLARL